MIPLVDIHCHLLAGLDDGPRTEDDALEMCRNACADGYEMTVALAHQNEHYPRVTPEVIRTSAQKLAGRLGEEGISLEVCPSAEIMAQPDLDAAWNNGQLLSVADRGQYLLIEMPDGLFVDLLQTVAKLRAAGVGTILAHPERHPEFLHGDGRIEEMIEAGCLVQVSARSVTHNANRQDRHSLRDWFRRGIVHVMGSDGHSVKRRPVGLSAAYHQIAAWAGPLMADRVCSTNGMAILRGLPLSIPKPTPARKWWMPALW